jgi:glucose/arabinose dehydrogenase
LLSIAFHPQYAQNGFFFVYYTGPSGNVTIARYHVSGDPNVADPNSGVTLISIPHPVSNHNGGQLQFGPDGYLYAGVGDGGGGCDDTNGGCNAQRADTMLGKMLRIDVDQNVNASPYYGVPPTNPFVGPGGFADEVWNRGLRNPWRFAFDRLTRALFIGDVGQVTREEVDYQLAESLGGENYGWKIMEGFLCNTCALTGCTAPPPCNDPSLTLPILDYAHSPHCAITGGYVYRGKRIGFLRGKYLYGDLCSGTLWWAVQNGGAGRRLRSPKRRRSSRPSARTLPASCMSAAATVPSRRSSRARSVECGGLSAARGAGRWLGRSQRRHGGNKVVVLPRLPPGGRARALAWHRHC